ncbi:MAG: TonB-dependent receptor [Pseudomonadota bacterium]
MHRSRILHTLLFTTTALVSTQVFAQEAGSGSETRLNRIVVGAGQEKVATDVPQSVTVLNQEDIDDAAPTTVGELFDEIPGVTTSGSERVLGESFNIRGIGAGEDQSDEGRFIITIDDVLKNYQQYRMGGLFTDPELYNKVEALRGPAASTLYGAGALAGVIRFETKDASDILKDGETAAVRIRTAWESNREEVTTSTALAWRPNENAEFFVYGTFREGRDYETGNGTVIDADFEAFSGIAKGTFHFGEDNEQALRISYQRWQTEAENQQYAQTVDSATFGRVDREVTDEQFLVSYENPVLGNDLLDFKAQVSYTDTVNQERNATVFFFGPGPGVQFFPDADFRYRDWQFRFENTSYFSGDNWEHYLTTGIQYSNLERSLALRDTGAQPEGTDEKIGIFAQSEIIFNDRLTITPGMRVDFRTLDPDQSAIAGFLANGTAGVGDISETAYSPKIIGHYKLDDIWSVFASYAHTERFATLDEVFDYRTGQFPGNNLTKEKSDNFEVGFSYDNVDILSEGDEFQLKTTFYHNTINDYIVRSPFASTRGNMGLPGPGTAFVNFDEVERYGVEVEFAYDADHWFMNGGASLIRGDDLLMFNGGGTRVVDTIAADEVFLKIGAKIPEHDLKYGWNSRFVDNQDGVAGGRPSTPGFATHGIFVSWIPEDNEFEGIEFRASVENLFDKQYKEFLSNDPAPGRTFKVSLVKRFGQ